jgi:pyruvate dehydrogenase E2 component (dihydrolipoamide acetyltransferase)
MNVQVKPFGAHFPPWPVVDFAEFGPTQVKPLSRIQQFSGNFLARNWAMIPHVTHHEEADITLLEERRRILAKAGKKFTLLPFLVKAVVQALKEFPDFNASLDSDGKHLVLKQYYHIGLAVDTPNGLLVPVIRDCDRKSIAELGEEIAARAKKAREKGLTMAEMSGGCFSISSLGSMGGTAFTPIINAPEVAILGVTKTQIRPMPGQFAAIDWRTMLPLSLSYDHRVINGADAARFMARLAALLQDPDRIDAWCNDL